MIKWWWELHQCTISGKKLLQIFKVQNTSTTWLLDADLWGNAGEWGVPGQGVYPGPKFTAEFRKKGIKYDCEWDTGLCPCLALHASNRGQVIQCPVFLICKKYFLFC